MIKVKRINANVRYVYAYEDNSKVLQLVVLVSFETPVAIYQVSTHTVQSTDIPWGASLSKQIGAFYRFVRNMHAKETGMKGSYPTCETIGQEGIDFELERITGDKRLSETRPPHVR